VRKWTTPTNPNHDLIPNPNNNRNAKLILFLIPAPNLTLPNWGWDPELGIWAVRAIPNERNKQ